MVPPMRPPRPMDMSRLCPRSLPGTPRRRISPSFLRSLRINREDRFEANIQAIPSKGMAISSVARPIKREISARKRIETLQQLEIVRHHKNDTDVRNKRNRTDFVHKVAIDLGSLQANDASKAQTKKPGALLFVFGINPHGKRARALQRQKGLAHMLLGSNQGKKRTVFLGRSWTRFGGQQIDIRCRKNRHP